jgi:hypothetical protein
MAYSSTPDSDDARGYALSTGRLLFIVLTIALAPLGLIAAGAGLNNIAGTDADRVVLLDVNVRRMAATLATRFASDEAIANRIGRTALPRDNDDVTGTAPADESIAGAGRGSAGTATGRAAIAATCFALAPQFPGGNGRVSATVIAAASGMDLCSPGVPPTATSASTTSSIIDLANQRLELAYRSTIPDARIKISYPLPLISQWIDHPLGRDMQRLTMTSVGNSLVLHDMQTPDWQPLLIEARAPVAQTGLVLRLSQPRSWNELPQIISLLVPLTMWLVAAGLSWLIVGRMLLSPIRRLMSAMSDYRPGDVIHPTRQRLFVAREALEIDRRLVGLTQSVARDQQALADGISQQAALTREVHHRVKNNLQIISSLINLHSRDATGAEGVNAYRTIQRRVEALAVVHRHLFANSEAGAGIDLAAMLGELGTSLRSATDSGRATIPLMIQTVPVRVVQDVALPVAFFITELVELASVTDAVQPITVGLTPPTGGRTTLSVTSMALAGEPVSGSHGHDNYFRVINGLARQLRQPLRHDAAVGCYAVDIPVIDPDGG